MKSFEDILHQAKTRGRKRAVVAPAPGSDMSAALSRATDLGLIHSIIVDNDPRGGLAERNPGHVQEGTYDPSTDDSLWQAVRMVRQGEADILIQGAKPLGDFLHIVKDPENGLGTAATLSFVSVFDSLQAGRLSLVTDTLINDFPTLEQKIGIIKNLVNFAHVLDIKRPKLAVLSALELVNPAIPSTLDAAILAKMSERGQLGEAMVEGPLDIDCAVSTEAAHRKGVSHPNTGQFDAFLLPDIESAYSFMQFLLLFGGFPMAGVLLGTRSPVVLDLDFQRSAARVIELAIAVLMAPRLEGDHDLLL
ncbi:MAG: phosphate butyryltransferase [Deltaproteobacteria bacterium]|nr:phosphate butyryltransferase [Deltaproteobacteria bacterium]MBW2070293.1 phosphate butyryltransferase [Deltaproteobacteria bacterium]